MRQKDFLSIDQLAPDELTGLVRLAGELKQERTMPDPSLRLRSGQAIGSGQAQPLAGRTVALLFQKPSLRTRVSFEVAASQLGARPLYLSPAEVGLGEREDVADVARVLSRYVDAIVARTFFHEDIEALAEHANVPVINGLSDRSHPCQILGDLLTIEEALGRIEGMVVAFVGDGNNVVRSLVEAAPRAGFTLRVATPVGYGPDRDAVAEALAMDPESIVIGNDPGTAARGADVIYTDVWFSMGQEAQRESRVHLFPPYQVNEKLVAEAAPHAIVMHCLPAHRGEEITGAVLEGPHSVVFDQAENRLYAQKALLLELLGGGRD